MLSAAFKIDLEENNWKAAIQNNSYQIKLIILLLVFISILILFPYFFQFIEKRNGTSLHDFIVESLPPENVSIPLFTCIWSITAIVIIRGVQNPKLFLVTLCSFILLTLLRMLTIYLVPLNPPKGLIPLIDPISNFFYGDSSHFVSKDLFFSGHTSSMFLFFLCLDKKLLKVIAFFATICVGALVLIQHVHYSIDVLAAFPLTYCCYRLGNKIVAIK